MKNRKRECMYMGMCAVIIFLFSLVLFRNYIFKGYYFFNAGRMSDIIRANVPWYYHLYDAIAEGGYFWSWCMGAGTSIFSHADSIFDPFVYVTFLFGRSHILSMLIWMFVIKIMCQGMTFFKYVRYFDVDYRAAILASIVYAYSGYSMIMGSNFALGTILVYLPLILLGAEKYLCEDKKMLLFVSLWLTCLLSYYFFYVTALGLAIYTVCRMWYRYKLSWKKLFGLAGIGLLTVGCSMFFLLPQIELVLQSPRTGNMSSALSIFSVFVVSAKTLFTALIRSVSNDALGDTYTIAYQGWCYGVADYFQESQFAGTFFLYFLGIILSEPNKCKRKKNIWLVVFILVCILYPVISYAANAFTMITARWMYWVTIVQCIIIALAFDLLIKEYPRFSPTIYWCSFIACFGLSYVGILVIAWGRGIGVLSDLCNALSTHFLWIGALYILIPIIYGMIHRLCPDEYKQYKTVIISIFALVVLLGDICWNYYPWYGSSYAVSEYTEENALNYLDTSAGMISKLLPEKNEFYRINKSFDSVVDTGGIPSENDAMVQGYYGLKNYNSLGNASYIEFLSKSGCYCTSPSFIPSYIEQGIKPTELTGQQLNYINGVEDRYNLMIYLGVKYYLSKTDGEEVPEYFHQIMSENGIHVYECDYSMPLTFCNQNIISEEQFENLTNDEKDVALLSCTVLSEEKQNDIVLPSMKQALQNVQDNQSRCKIISFSNDLVKCEIEVPENGRYISTTIPYDRNWIVYIDGKQVSSTKVNLGFVGCAVEEGNHTVEFRYHPKMFYFGAWVSLFSILVVLLCVVFNMQKQKRADKAC